MGIYFLLNLQLVTILHTDFIFNLPLSVLRKLTVHGFQEPQQNMEVMVSLIVISPLSAGDPPHIFEKADIFLFVFRVENMDGRCD